MGYATGASTDSIYPLVEALVDYTMYTIAKHRNGADHESSAGSQNGHLNNSEMAPNAKYVHMTKGRREGREKERGRMRR